MLPTSPTATKTANAPSAATIPPEPQVLQSQDLVASLPAPVFRLLVIFAYPISKLRTALEIICWKPGRRVQSWMLVGAWWGVCLGSKHVFRWLLPALVFLPLIPLSTLRLKSSTTAEKDGKTPTQSVTTETVLVTLHDLHSIHALLPPSPLPSFSSVYTRFRQLGAWRLSRGLVVIWATWVILGHIIGFRTLLAILGTVLLLLPSPSLAHLVDLLSKSLAVRRAMALAFLFTFGSPPEQSYRMTLDFSPSTWIKSKWAVSRRPSLAFSFRPTLGKGDVPASAIADDEDGEDGKVENPIYFRFEVHENQRWWMGLDWTSALLPQERPSWCDSHLLPVSPPPSFTLPPPASIILPAPTPTDPHARVKRTATWRWLDDDWSTVRAGQGSTSSNTTVIHPPPISENDVAAGQVPRSLSMSFGTSPPQHHDEFNSSNSATSGVRAQSIAEQAFAKGLERLKARTGVPQAKPPSPRSSVELVRPRTGSQASEDSESMHPMAMSTAVGGQVPMETIRERDDATDADGWVYGDNKWENMGAKGGLGRFTRRRRWHRRAVCTEIVQKLPTEVISPVVPQPLKSEATVAATPIISTPAIDVGVETPSSELGEKISNIPTGVGPTVRDDILRQRLKKAMGSMGG